MKSKDLINEIYDLYDAYISKVTELEKNKKITAGLFGLTKGPKDDPCHDQFADELKEKISRFADSDPDPEDVFTLLEYMYSAPLKNTEINMIYWMFTGVHTLALDLISRLDRESACKLYEQYNRDYPRRERLPAQKKTLKLLKEMV